MRKKKEVTIENLEERSVVNIEPKAQTRRCDLVGVYQRNFLIKELRDAFPLRAELWYVDEMWMWQKVAVDHAYSEEDKKNTELKRPIIEKLFEYRVEK